MHLSRDQVGDRERGAAIGDVRHLDPGLVGKQLGDEMVGAADAGGAVIQRARLALRQRHQLGDSLHAERRVHHQDIGIGRGHADRHQVLFRIVGEFRVDARVDRDRTGLTEQQRVAVRIGALDDLGADAAIAAAAIFDHEGLAERVADFLADDARGRVRRAAGRERHDQPDRVGRIVLRLRGCRGPGMQAPAAAGQTFASVPPELRRVTRGSDLSGTIGRKCRGGPLPRALRFSSFRRMLRQNPEEICCTNLT